MIPKANDTSGDLKPLPASAQAPLDAIRWGRTGQLMAILWMVASPARPITPPYSPTSAQLESLSPPVVTLQIRFDDGTRPAHVGDLRFLRQIQPEGYLGRALATSDPSVAVVRKLLPGTRWVNVYAYAPFPEFNVPESVSPGRSALDFMARYDIFLPFDASDITTDTERKLILPRGNASLRVILLPPEGADDAMVTAQLETVWRPGESSMIMPGRPRADGSTLFAPVWPGVYYVYCTCNGVHYRRPVAIQDGEHRNEGVWPWPDGRIRGQLLNPDGSPAPFTRLHFLLEETDGFDLPSLGAIPIEAASAVTDGSGRFQCTSVLPGTYQATVLPVYRWDQGEGPDRWVFATRERVLVGSGVTAANVRLTVKPKWLKDPRYQSSRAPRPMQCYTYDPTNGTVSGGGLWRVRQ